MQNNSQRYTLIAIGVLLPLLAIIIMSFDNQITSQIAIDAGLLDQNKDRIYEVGEPIHYKDNTEGVKSRVWYFGNGEKSEKAEGYISYNEPGRYLVTLLINEKFQQNLEIEVRGVIPNLPIDSVITIVGPDTAYVNEELVFSAYADGVTNWMWEFGESKIVDAYEGQVKYTYSGTGDYLIQLITNISKYPVYHTIHVRKRFTIEKPEEPVDSLQLMCDDIKKYLNEIAQTSVHNQGKFIKKRNALQNKYLQHKKAKTTFIINGDKYNDYYSYAQGLHHLDSKEYGKLRITAVEVELEEEDFTKINSVIVTQEEATSSTASVK